MQAIEIARAVNGLYVDLPKDWDSNGDINDLHKKTGSLRVVKELLESAKMPPLKENNEDIQQEGSTLNDVGNARRLVARYGQNIRWLSETKKWMIWNGQSWVMDEVSGIMKLAKETVQSIYNEAGTQKDVDKGRQISRWANVSSFLPRLTAMGELAKSEPGITLSISEFDKNPMLIGTPSGVIDLNTGLPIPACREHYITKKIGIEYANNAKCPVWEQFLTKCFNGNDEIIKYLQRAVGYTLTGLVSEQKLFFLYGSGANGKSVFLEALRYVLGDYAMHAQADMFMQSKTERASNGIARLKGARMVSAIEVEDGHRFAESLVKQLTGGDRITGRFLYGEHFEFDPTAKFWFAANYKPIIRGDDHAIWRRFDLIPFLVTIPEDERDNELISKLKAEAEGILQWALQGAMEWQRIGLRSPSEITIATAQYKEEMDIIAMWLKDCCVVAAEKSANLQVLYASYIRWSQENDLHSMRRSNFVSKLEQRFVYSRGGKGMKFWGLELL